MVLALRDALYASTRRQSMNRLINHSYITLGESTEDDDSRPHRPRCLIVTKREVLCFVAWISPARSCNRGSKTRKAKGKRCLGIWARLGPGPCHSNYCRLAKSHRHIARGALGGRAPPRRRKNFGVKFTRISFKCTPRESVHLPGSASRFF